MIYNHPSFFDWAFAFAPLYPRRVNAIMNYYYFCNYRLGTLLNKIGAFPKYLFQPDISAVKNIKRVIKNGGIVGIAPEGRLSPHGRMESITAATAKLLKNLGVPVILAKINGAYFSYPKWAKTYRRGRVDVNYRELFDAERIKIFRSKKSRKFSKESSPTTTINGRRRRASSSRASGSRKVLRTSSISAPPASASSL